MSEKKHHKPHYEDENVRQTKFYKEYQRRIEIEEDEMFIEEEHEDLFRKFDIRKFLN